MILNAIVLMLICTHLFTVAFKNEKNIVWVSICQFVICSLIIFLETILMFYNINNDGFWISNMVILALQVFQIALTNHTLNKHRKNEQEKQSRYTKNQVDSDEIVV